MPSPLRFVELTPLLRRLVPEPLAPVVVLVSHLGDPFFLLGLLVLVYWFGDRDAGIRLLGLGLASFGFVLAAKHLLAVPRPTVGPPVPVESVPWLLRPSYEVATGGTSSAVPSGHALASTVVYGGLAARRSVRDRLGAGRVAVTAAGLVVAVCLVRVYLGAHYAGDVVAGVVLGLALLAATRRLLTPRRPVVTLWVAAGFGTVAAGLSPTETEALAVFGGTLGATVAWSTVAVPRDSWPRSLAVVGPVAAAGLVCVAGAAVLFVFQSPLVVVLAAAVGLGTVVAVPALRLR
ncbi:phosphatase PAP2 family protein [Haloarchaeobius sp. TZWWS8]|uniref:phosphatase PAP2 family protein n=1 Tax=Haloarchaeobius sp. TZWWS8 TaxID=3446121 RepID=UPI003EB98D4B